MRRSLKAVVTDKKGISEIVGAVVGLMVLVMALVICIGGIKLVNQYTTLNEFGDQLIKVASDYGQCGGTVYTDTYQKLVSATTMSPIAEFTADFFNAGKKTVQYGEPIKLTLVWEANFGVIPITMNITKIGRSEQYWK